MSVYTLEIRDEYGVEALPVERIEQVVTWVLSQHGVQPGMALTLVITDDETVQQLNAQYRGVDAPTDILSFPTEPLPENLRQEMSEDEDEGEALYLGDLIVAYPYTLSHAQENGHAMTDELMLLAIHGSLHLLGFDHDTAEHQQTMWAAQAEALTALGVLIDVPLFRFEDEPDA
jgi:probable rRNA maturation factor